MAALFALAVAALVAGRDGSWAASLPPGDVRLPAGVYRGPWRIGKGVHLLALAGAVLEGGDPVLSITGDDVAVSGLAVHATGVGISARGVRGLTLSDVSVSGGQQGIYLAEAEARIVRGTLVGSDYGILAWQTRIEAAGGRVAHVHRAGIALVRSSGAVHGCSFEGPFFEAAISVLGAARIELRRNRIRRAGAIGLKLLNSEGELSENDVAGARSDARGLEGDDVYLFDSRVRSRGDVLDDAEATGLTVLGGRAKVSGCRILRTGQAAYVGEKGQLFLTGCTIDRAAVGLVVEPDSSGTAEDTKFLHIGAPDGGT
ncbi:MAG: NosD domain-containing protein [Myxococcales bacterium]